MSARSFRPETGLPDIDSARFTAAQRFECVIPHGARFGALIQDNLHLPRTTYEVDVPPIGRHVLVFALSSRRTRWETRLAGRPLSIEPRPDDLMVVPAGADCFFRGSLGAERVMHLHLAPDWLEALAREAGLSGLPALDIVPQLRDAPMTTLFRRMATTLRHEPPAALLCEHAAMLAAVELLRLFQGRPPRERHHIAPHRMRAVRAHIEERLAEDITLAELAAVARLSRFHFARCFRAETGLTPLAYVTQRRVERAKRVMLEEALPLCEVALACGFAHQAHFTTAFRRVVGTTPGRWREERLS
jgi:AraC family transcriptional regulator